jgi:predicted transposase YdaD
LETLMQSGSYEYQTEFVRKYVAQIEQGHQQGHEEGRKEGRHEGELAALLEVLDARGLKVSAAVRKQILACTDPAQLKHWLRKAATAESAQELFSNEPTPKPSVRTAVKTGRSLKASKPRSKR